MLFQSIISICSVRFRALIFELKELLITSGASKLKLAYINSTSFAFFPQLLPEIKTLNCQIKRPFKNTMWVVAQHNNHNKSTVPSGKAYLIVQQFIANPLVRPTCNVLRAVNLLSARALSPSTRPKKIN